MVRTWKQAIGFYIAYLCVYLLVGAITGVAVAVSTGSSDTDMIYRVAGPLVVLMTATVCILMITKKNLGFMYWILGIVACGLSVLGGGILGLIIPAYISTVSTTSSEDAPKLDVPHTDVSKSETPTA